MFNWLPGPFASANKCHSSQLLTLRFQNAVLPLQIVNVLLVGIVFPTHVANVFGGLAQYLRSAGLRLSRIGRTLDVDAFVAGQRWHGFAQRRETVLDVIASLAFQCIVMGALFRLNATMSSQKQRRWTERETEKERDRIYTLDTNIQYFRIHSRIGKLNDSIF